MVLYKLVWIPTYIYIYIYIYSSAEATRLLSYIFILIWHILQLVNRDKSKHANQGYFGWTHCSMKYITYVCIWQLSLFFYESFPCLLRRYYHFWLIPLLHRKMVFAIVLPRNHNHMCSTKGKFGDKLYHIAY